MCESFKQSLKNYEEQITAPNLSPPAPDEHLNDLQKQGFSAIQEGNAYQQPYTVDLWNKVSFDIQPTNSQADITATGNCENWITIIDLMKYQESVKVCLLRSALTYYERPLKGQNPGVYTITSNLLPLALHQNS
jgi:hypothetical protein